MINSDMTTPGFIRIDPAAMDAIDRVFHISRSPDMARYLMENVEQHMTLATAMEEFVDEYLIVRYCATGVYEVMFS